MTLALSLYAFVLVFEVLLEFLNLGHNKKNLPLPHELEKELTSEGLEKARRYLIDKTRLSMVYRLATGVAFAGFLVFFLEGYDRWIGSLGLSFISSGVVFFLLLGYAGALLSLPFGFYHVFIIEKRYGFTTQTVRGWVADALKSQAISTILTVVVCYAGLYIVEASPRLWWLWIWCFLFAFGVFMMYLSPYVIEPLFNKFEPLGDPALEEGIRQVLTKAGIRVSKVLKVDASRRTTHTNAYFTGIGGVKRIVLFDTLLKSFGRGEVVSVLAHEAGHWKKRHLIKSLAVMELVALAALFVSFYLMNQGLPDRIFSLERGSFFAGVAVLAFLGFIASFPLRPILLYFSRRHEREADSFACALTGKDDMISALVRLSKENLSNLSPHPLYAVFRYSHPPVAQRIRRIRGL